MHTTAEGDVSTYLPLICLSIPRCSFLSFDRHSLTYIAALILLTPVQITRKTNLFFRVWLFTQQRHFAIRNILATPREVRNSNVCATVLSTLRWSARAKTAAGRLASYII